MNTVRLVQTVCFFSSPTHIAEVFDLHFENLQLTHIVIACAFFDSKTTAIKANLKLDIHR